MINHKSTYVTIVEFNFKVLLLKQCRQTPPQYYYNTCHYCSLVVRGGAGRAEITRSFNSPEPPRPQ